MCMPSFKKSMMYGDLPSKGSAFGGAKKGTVW